MFDDSNFRVSDLGFGVQGVGFEIEGEGIRVRLFWGFACRNAAEFISDKVS